MVSLRNVNLRAEYRIPCALHDNVGTSFLTSEDKEDSVAGPSQRTYLAESSAEASAERSRPLVTLTKNKTKRARREQELNSRNHVLEILHKPSIVTLPLFCIVL